MMTVDNSLECFRGVIFSNQRYVIFYPIILLLHHLICISAAAPDALAVIDSSETAPMGNQSHPQKMRTCRTCFAYCTNINQCNKDCANSESVCMAPHCFTRLDLLENGYLALQAGCSNFNPGKNGTPGCYVSGPHQEFTQYCYCNQDLCNAQTETPQTDVSEDSGSISCCQWRAHISSDQDPETTWAGSCPVHCSKASFCSTDFMDQSKSCGYGLPGFYRDVWPDTGALNTGDALCLQYEAGYQFRSHHCVCNTEYCNKDASVPQYSRTDNLKCHACHQASQGDAIIGDNCHQNDACQGSLCFLSYTTAELIQDYDFDSELYGPPQMESGIYDLTMGCLNVNRPEVVRLGCRAEWKDSAEPISVHCICGEVGCNSAELLEYELGRIRRTASGAPTRQSILQNGKHSSNSFRTLNNNNHNNNNNNNNKGFIEVPQGDGEGLFKGDEYGSGGERRHYSSSSSPRGESTLTEENGGEMASKTGTTEERVSAKSTPILHSSSHGGFVIFSIYLTISSV